MTTADLVTHPVEVVYSSSTIIASDEAERAAGATTDPAPSRKLDAIAASFAKLNVPGATPFGEAKKYRQVRIDGWPVGVHYEFVGAKVRTFADLHLESAELSYLSPVLEQLTAEVASAAQGVIVRHLPNRWKLGALRLRHESGSTPEEVARTMEVLIGATREAIESELAAHGDLRD